MSTAPVAEAEVSLGPRCRSDACAIQTPAIYPPAIYTGTVVHARTRPTRHRLQYPMFFLLTDIDRLAETARHLRLLSFNRANVFSIDDRDHGPGDGRPLSVQAREALAMAGLAHCGDRIMMLATPRLFGSTFNPLTVYYCHSASGNLGALIYEVGNTVGERTSYVLPAGPPQHRGTASAVYTQSCAKRMYVSPFTPAAGTYGFRVTQPSADLVLGVSLADDRGGLVRTHFAGTAVPLSDRHLAPLVWRFPWPTLATASAIHLEALRLRLKGVPLVRRHVSPRYSVAVAAETQPATTRRPVQ